MSDQLLWPPTFAEQNPAGDIHIRPDDIANYAYPQGRRERYTFSGWGKAMDLGIAELRVEMFGAKGDSGGTA